MGHIHALEFEDLRWLPGNLRNYVTDFLQFGTNAFDMYRPVIHFLQKGIESSALTWEVGIAKGEPVDVESWNSKKYL